MPGGNETDSSKLMKQLNSIANAISTPSPGIKAPAPKPSVTAKGMIRAARKVQQVANAKATATKRSKQNVIFDNRLYWDLRLDTFDTK